MDDTVWCFNIWITYAYNNKETFLNFRKYSETNALDFLEILKKKMDVAKLPISKLLTIP